MGIKAGMAIVCMLLCIGEAVADSATAESLETERPFRLGAALGYSFAEYREDTDLPLKRKQHSPSFAINGAIEAGKFIHSINAGFFTGKSKGIMTYSYDTIWNEPADWHFAYYSKEDTFTRINAEYALDFRLWGNKTFPGYLGGAIRADFYIINTLNNLLYRKSTGIFSLGIHAAQKWIVNERNIFSLTVGIPFLGYAIRPSYIGTSYPIDKGIASFHNYWAFFGELKYRFKINSLVSLNPGFAFDFFRIEFPRPGKYLMLSASLGIDFSF